MKRNFLSVTAFAVLGATPTIAAVSPVDQLSAAAERLRGPESQSFFEILTQLAQTTTTTPSPTPTTTPTPTIPTPPPKDQATDKNLSDKSATDKSMQDNVGPHAANFPSPSVSAEEVADLKAKNSILEEGLAQGGQQHFIVRELRPDLSFSAFLHDPYLTGSKLREIRSAYADHLSKLLDAI